MTQHTPRPVLSTTITTTSSAVAMLPMGVALPQDKHDEWVAALDQSRVPDAQHFTIVLIRQYLENLAVKQAMLTEFKWDDFDDNIRALMNRMHAACAMIRTDFSHCATAKVFPRMSTLWELQLLMMQFRCLWPQLQLPSAASTLLLLQIPPSFLYPSQSIPPLFPSDSADVPLSLISPIKVRVPSVVLANIHLRRNARTTWILCWIKI